MRERGREKTVRDGGELMSQGCLCCRHRRLVFGEDFPGAAGGQEGGILM